MWPDKQQYMPRTTIVARSTQGQRLATDIRTLLASLNPNLPIVQSQTLEDYPALTLIPQRIAARCLAVSHRRLLLAAIGIDGVTAYMVSSRTREIGIRMALGAQRGSVLRMVLRQGVTLALTGVVIGLVLAAGASRLLGSLLFGVGPTIRSRSSLGRAVLCDRSGRVLRAGTPRDRDRCHGSAQIRVGK